MKLYFFPGSAALPAHMLLEEIGAAYDLVRVDRDAGDLDRDWFRRLNPFGRIPVLTHQDVTVFETGPVLTFIAEHHPDAGMIPAAGSAGRTRYDQWLSLLASDIQQAFMVRSYPHRWIGDEAGQETVAAAAEQKLAAQFDTLDTFLGPGPYILGDALSAADFYLFLLTGYGRRLSPKAWDRPAIGRHFALLLERPSVQAAMQQQGLTWK